MNGMAYRIVGWKENYEVTSKGRPAEADTPIDELRISKLPYIRFKNTGHSLGPAFRKMNKEAWKHGNEMCPATFGVFGKLLELAGNQSREYRGWILDHKQKPMDEKAIAELLEWDVDVVSCAIGVLCVDDGWLELVDFRIDPDCSGNSATVAERRGGNMELLVGGEREPFKKRSETETENKGELKKRVSGIAPDVSVSDSGDISARQIKAARGQAVLRVCEILRIGKLSKSDATTMRDIFDQLETSVLNGTRTLEIFEAVVDVAKECNGTNKIAMFVTFMKDNQFGYIPKRRRWLSPLSVK